MKKRKRKPTVETVPAWIVTPPNGTTKHLTIAGLYDLAVSFGMPPALDFVLESAKIVPYLRGQKCCVDYSPFIEEDEDNDAKLL